MPSMYRRLSVRLVGAVTRAVAMVVVGGMVQTGCADAGGQPSRMAACELLGRAEVAEILEGAVTQPAASQSSATDALAGRSGCAWATEDDTKAVLVELVRTGDMADEVRRTGFSASARFDAARGQHPDAKQHAVGDKAMYVPETATLHVLVGRTYLTFEVAASPPSRVEGMAVALATRAIARLRGSGRAD